MNGNWTKLWAIVAIIALALTAVATTLAGIAIWTPPEEAVPRAYQCDVYTEQGCAKYVVASGGELEVQSGGGLDVQEGATFAPNFSGDLTLENGEVISNSTDGDVFVNGDLLGFTNVVSKAESYTQLNVETGSLYVNIGAGAGYTWTLPAAATGLRYCYYLAVTQIVTISPAAADLIHHLTNSAGDRITNTVAGDTLCLTAIDDVNWVPSNETGSWNDID